MIRASIVGIGRWGRTLVGGVQGKSTAIRFTAGQMRSKVTGRSAPGAAEPVPGGRRLAGGTAVRARGVPRGGARGGRRGRG